MIVLCRLSLIIKYFEEEDLKEDKNLRTTEIFKRKSFCHLQLCNKYRQNYCLKKYQLNYDFKHYSLMGLKLNLKII